MACTVIVTSFIFITIPRKQGGMEERMARLERLVTNWSSEIGKLARSTPSQAPPISGAQIGRSTCIIMRVRWGMRSALRVYFVVLMGLVICRFLVRRARCATFGR